MTQPSTLKAYDEWHGRLAVDRAADAPWHRLVKVHLRPESDIAGQRVLEIGCGRGGFSLWLATQARRPRLLVSADLSTVAVAKGKAALLQHHVDAPRWEVADIESIPHARGTFDTVISCETIEHVPDPRRAIRELARVLRPGGRLFLTTPNYLGVFGLYRGYLRIRGRRYTEEGQPINHFTTLPSTLRWVTEAGLQVLAVDGVGHYVPIPGRQPPRIYFLDRMSFLTRWLALHSLVVAGKP